MSEENIYHSKSNILREVRLLPLHAFWSNHSWGWMSIFSRFMYTGHVNTTHLQIYTDTDNHITHTITDHTNNLILLPTLAEQRDPTVKIYPCMYKVDPFVMEIRTKLLNINLTIRSILSLFAVLDAQEIVPLCCKSYAASTNAYTTGLHIYSLFFPE